ncbi:MAG: PDZ domain-containing protein [Deltaproteobacteria bacterium]|uniref:ChaN family lipoprotein n=1 Tax=Hydrosulfovibrio ferrireducens TaxID=2934181 RepID=UPI00120F53B0|nr:MAG: PDZ domain-containing protein [Deltaproteobacteria bacterium]
MRFPLCLLLFFGLLILSVPASAAAPHPAPPRHQLDIAFDLQSHRLIGTSRITIPAQTAVTISLANLEIMQFDLDGVTLQTSEHVVLPSAPQDQHVAIRFHTSYAGNRADTLNGLIDPSGIALTGFWHPRLDTDCQYALTAAIPKHFAAISEAEEISDTLSGNIRTVRFLFEHPLPGLNFVAGPYVVEEEPIGPGQTLYSYFFAEDRELAAGYRKKTIEYLKRYQELIGPYPYKRFSIVENRLPTGYAMPTFTLLGQAVVRLPFITETSLGHEVLHSWFGNSVDVDTSQGNWCEGLTTYLADQAFAADKGADAAFRKQQLITYQSYVGPDNTMTLADFSGAGSHLASGNKAARAVGYEKGSMLFHMLFREIGDVPFYAGLRDVYARFRHQQASWQDLAARFSKSSSQNLEPFFSQWLGRADLPRLEISSGALTERGDHLELGLTIKQLQEKPYRLRLPLDIVTAKGKERREVTLTESETKVRIRLTDYPSLVIGDPDYDLMRTLAPEELPPTWSRFLGARERLAIAPAGDELRVYAPLIELLAAMECPVKPANEATDKDLAGKAVLFLGTDSPLARSIFAGQPHQPATGFTLEARENPLAPGQVAVLIASASTAETAAAAPKLAHYGKYGTLHLNLGRVAQKSVLETEQGLRLVIDAPPMALALPKALSFAAITEQLGDKQVVYVGENHTRNEDHLLQLRVIRALFAQNPKLAIGMEMFSREAQPVLDRYVAGELNEREFLKQSEYFSKWGYDYRFYREIINFARRHRLPIVALNQEKAIVNKVFKEGTAALTAEELAKIPADRDLTIPGYRERITEVFTMHGSHGGKPEQVNGFFQAQALWDETMAESVTSFLAAHPERRMVVLAGQGHTDKATAIPPRVARRLSAIRQAVILNSMGRELDQTETDYLIFSEPDELPPAALLGVMLGNTADGPRVEGLSEKSKAGAAGIRKKDVILALDDEPVTTIDDLKIFLLDKEIGNQVTVRIKRETGFLFKGESILSIPVVL